MSRNEQHTILDLFAGAGGLSEGFWQSGFDLVCHVEMDRDACETLITRAIFHELKKLRCLDDYYKYIAGSLSRTEILDKHKIGHCLQSVINTEIDASSYSRVLSEINLLLGNRKLDGIIGGPPCQAYSNIGRARDKNSMVGDKRNYLYKFYLRFLKDLQPNYFVFENVPGLFSAGEGKYLSSMISGMRRLGYVVPEPSLLNSADYNIPQNRKRVIVVGWKKHVDFDIDNIFSTPEQLPFTVEDFLSDLEPLQAGDTRVLSRYVHDSPIMKSLGISCSSGRVSGHIARPHNPRDKKIYKIAVEKYLTGERLKYCDLPEKLKTHKNQTSFLDRFKVVSGKERAAQTVVAHISKDGHYYIHPDLHQNRSLTVREAARLQTFPDNFKFEGSRTSMFRQIGNAVPPRMATHLAERISQQILFKKPRFRSAS